MHVCVYNRKGVKNKTYRLTTVEEKTVASRWFTVCHFNKDISIKYKKLRSLTIRQSQSESRYKHSRFLKRSVFQNKNNWRWQLSLKDIWLIPLSNKQYLYFNMIQPVMTILSIKRYQISTKETLEEMLL